VGTTTKA